MDGVFTETEAHQDGLGAENALESGDNRDAAATASGDGTFAESGLVSLFSSLVGRHIQRGNVGFATMTRSHLHLHGFRSDGLEVFLE